MSKTPPQTGSNGTVGPGDGAAPGGATMIREVLGTGAAEAITARALSEMLHISRREVVRRVRYERREGTPICSSTDNQRPGYYLARNQGEMKRYCEALERRAEEITRTRENCLDALPSLPAE